MLERKARIIVLCRVSGGENAAMNRAERVDLLCLTKGWQVLQDIADPACIAWRFLIIKKHGWHSWCLLCG
jgi:hypothetical protein